MTTSSCSARRIAAAICCCFLCAVFAFNLSPVKATEYNEVANVLSFFHNRTSVTNVQSAITNQNGSYTLINSLSIADYGVLNSGGYRYAAGCMFIDSFESYDDYRYTITLVPSVTSGFNVNNLSSYALHTCSIGAGYPTPPLVAESSTIAYNPTFEQSENGAYTFTFDKISYKDIINAKFIYFDTLISNVPTTTTGGGSNVQFEFYMTNVYFGLSSEFNEEVYNKEVAEKLDGIEDLLNNQNNKLDNIQGAVGDVGNKVDQAADDIQSGLDDVGNKVDSAADQISGDLNDVEDAILNQPQEEMDIADQKGSAASDDVNNALDDSGLTPSIDNTWTGVKRLATALTTNEIVSYIPIPEVKIPVIAGTGFNSEVVLIEDQEYSILNIVNIPAIKTLRNVTKVFYYLFFFCFMIDYLRKLFAKIFLTDVVTNEGAIARKEVEK